MANITTALLAAYKASTTVLVICNTCGTAHGILTPLSKGYTVDVTMCGSWTRRCEICGSVNLTVS